MGWLRFYAPPSGIRAARTLRSRMWSEIALRFLALGATAYGGPAIMGIMQAELQQKRHWVSKERFVEGLSLVNVLPGAGATQLAIFLGYVRGGWWGGLLAGGCFVVPGFIVMVALTVGYALLGMTPLARGALYGLSPVVLGVFVLAVFRLSQSALKRPIHAAVAVMAAIAVAATPLGIPTVLILAGGIGVLLFHSKRTGALVLASLTVPLAIAHVAGSSASRLVPTIGHAATLADVAMVFFLIGAFTFGGGLTMVAFIQDQVVNQLHWLTPQQFVDGLALGQFTPGPILMVAAYVGYKALGILGAMVGACAIFLPSFVLMLSALPLFERAQSLAWMRAAMMAIAPAVIGIFAVSLVRMAPYALPDAFAGAMLVTTVVVSLAWRVTPFPAMICGATVGILRSRLGALSTAKAALAATCRPAV